MVDVVADVHRAIEEATRRGTIRPLGAMILWLFYAQELTITQIAEMLGVSEKTVSRYRDVALRALRDTGILQGYDADD